MEEQWIEELRQKLADFEQPAPEVSWEEIEKAVAAHNRQAKKVAMWPRRIAAAILVVVTGGVGYYLLNRQEPDVVQQMESVVSEQSGEGIRQESVNPQQQTDNQTFASVRHQMRQAIRDLSENDTIAVVAIADEDQIALQKPEQKVFEIQEPNPEVQSSDSQISEIQASESQEPKSEVQPQKKSFPEVQTIYPSDIKRSASSSKRLMAKVYLSNAMLGNSGNSFNERVPVYSSFAGYYPQLDDLNMSDNTQTSSSDSENTEDYTNNVETAEPVEENVHHRQPIRFGLSLRYALNDRWSIDAGLSYTMLSSDFSFSATHYYAEVEQRLNYVGIPISVNYQLWSNRHFNVYASAGGIVEKMVKGKQHFKVTVPSISERDESVSIGPLQLSINGALGAEYQFVDWLSIYAEPGLGYYFDNGSSVPTFYQEKPLNFNLNLGLRLNIK